MNIGKFIIKFYMTHNILTILLFKPKKSVNINDIAMSGEVNLYNKVRIVCMIMTSPPNHMSKAIHVQQTWGKHCNTLLFMSSADGKFFFF